MRGAATGWAVRAAVLAAIVTGGASGARAQDAAATTPAGGRVYGSTTTLFRAYEILDPRDPTSRLYQLPIYEYLTLGTDDVGVKGFSIHLSGFGMANIKESPDTPRGTGDLLTGTLSYRTQNGVFLVKVGRQILFEGAGQNTLMDGAYLKVRPGADLELSAWGGAVPMSRFDYSGPGAVYGARLGYNPWDWGRIGVSFTEETSGTERVRSNLGVDYALRRLRWLDFSGYLVVDLLGGTFQETQNFVSFVLDRCWRISLEYGMFDPSGRIPKNSIFSVFTNGHYHQVGADVNWVSRGWASADAFFRYYLYQDGVQGYQVGLRPTLHFGRGRGDLVGLEFQRLQGLSNAYWEARAFGIWKPHPRADLTLDVENFFYDDEIKGFKRSHVIGLSAGWEFVPNARLQGDLTMTINPDFTQELSGLVKLTYAFSTFVKK